MKKLFKNNKNILSITALSLLSLCQYPLLASDSLANDMNEPNSPYKVSSTQNVSHEFESVSSTQNVSHEFESASSKQNVSHKFESGLSGFFDKLVDQIEDGAKEAFGVLADDVKDLLDGKTSSDQLGTIIIDQIKDGAKEALGVLIDDVKGIFDDGGLTSVIFGASAPSLVKDSNLALDAKSIITSLVTPDSNNADPVTGDSAIKDSNLALDAKSIITSLVTPDSDNADPVADKSITIVKDLVSNDQNDIVPVIADIQANVA